MRAKYINHIINFLFVIASFIVAFFSSAFLGYSSNENVAYNISKTLSQKDNSIYNRVIIKDDTTVDFKTYIDFERNYLRKMYMKSHIFSASKGTIDIGVLMDVTISEYDLKEESSKYLLQDVKYYMDYSFNQNESNAIIVSNNLAKKLAEMRGYGDDYSKLINDRIPILFLNKEVFIGSIYDANNGYNCTNKIYSYFGETILVNSSFLLDNLEMFNEIEHHYFFTLGPNYQINLNSLKVINSIFEKFSFPDYPPNNIFMEDINLNSYFRNYYDDYRTQIYIISIILLIAALSSLIFLCFRFQKTIFSKKDMYISVSAILLLSFLLLFLFCSIFSQTITIFSKTILLINSISVSIFIIFLLIEIAFCFIALLFNRRKIYNNLYEFGYTSIYEISI